jgi:hypothetical protein
MPSRVFIPKPCPASAQVLSPTEAGWHCARCQTEVIDFTRFSEVEILAYLASRQGQRVCAAMQAPLVPQPYKRLSNVRRLLLAVAAFLGWQSAGALPPQLPPRQFSFFGADAAANKQIVIRGVVLDDSLKVPVRGIYVFISGTKYGAITNERGEFVLALQAGWGPISHGEVLLDVRGVPFALQGQLVAVKVADNPTPSPLTVRLRSVPQRGHIKGKVRITPTPVAPPN